MALPSLDLYLRDQRFLKARPFIRDGDIVLDIGCEDGALFESLRGVIQHGIGIDPLITAKQETPLYTLLPGLFPQAIPEATRCDVITLLAVLEHISPSDQARLGRLCFDHLNPRGRVVITVPSPRVDRILHVLQFLHLIQAETLHEHYGFRVEGTPDLFAAPLFRMLHSRKFQLGLNNLFVFERL
jgi:2-polyprenyl-3-methyl-5-hydroxy-6-metoxy-1,4-benzoquinol methylase